MDKPSSDFHFKGMTLLFKIRDLFYPRAKVLNEVGIQPGSHVLDYGCGPGSYISPLAQIVGKTGKIYALDIHPLAVQKVHRIVSRKNISNIETILSDCSTGLPDNSIDVVLLYDILHELGEPDKVLRELHRTLKIEGVLSCSDHHLNESEIKAKLTNKGLFGFKNKGKKTFSFAKRA